MNITITNFTNHIEINYNDLSVEFGETTALYRKASVIELSLNITSNVVSLYLNTDRKYDITYEMVSLPVVANNLELYEALKTMLI